MAKKVLNHTSIWIRRKKINYKKIIIYYSVRAAIICFSLTATYYTYKYTKEEISGYIERKKTEKENRKKARELKIKEMEKQQEAQQIIFKAPENTKSNKIMTLILRQRYNLKINAIYIELDKSTITIQGETFGHMTLSDFTSSLASSKYLKLISSDIIPSEHRLNGKGGFEPINQIYTIAQTAQSSRSRRVVRVVNNPANSKDKEPIVDYSKAKLNQFQIKFSIGDLWLKYRRK